jgi:hypothetical protein
VENEGATDVLEARLGDFRFGAAFRLDAVSQGSRADNGDNLVQRGLSGDPAQYKLQLDGRVPACRVQGAAALSQCERSASARGDGMSRAATGMVRE